MKNWRGYSLVIYIFFFLNSISAQESGQKLIILHTNDLHSRLDGFAPANTYTPLSLNDDNTIGGFSRIATLIKNEKLNNPDKLLVLDDGDFLMGTIYHYMEEYNGFQLPLMKEMGFDFVAIGNHEFDFGPGKLSLILERSVLTGDIPEILLSNAEFDKDDADDDSLEELYKSGTLKRSAIIERSGIKIGLFSLIGKDADEVAPLAAPVSFANQKRSAKKFVKQLRKEGADIVICLSHGGVAKDKKSAWEGEDVKLAKKVKGLDIIISGHTHTELQEPLMVKETIIVQTGDYGRNLGRMELIVSGDNIELKKYELIPIDDSIRGDEKIQSRIDKQKSLIKEKLFTPLGYDPYETLIKSDFKLECDEYGGNIESSNLGPLIADAIYNYINTSSKPGSDIVMVAAGVIRDRINPGLLSIQDIFRVMSLGSGNDEIPGYPLATVYLSGIEIKRMMEILLVSSKSSPANYCFYSGLEADYNPDKGLLKKISAIRLVDSEGNKRPVDISKKSAELYSVSANAYMLEFIGIIKKTTFGLINVFPKFADGSPVEDMAEAIIDFNSSLPGVQEGKEWIALVEYLRSMEDSDEDGIPELSEIYRNPSPRLIPVETEK